MSAADAFASYIYPYSGCNNIHADNASRAFRNAMHTRMEVRGVIKQEPWHFCYCHLNLRGQQLDEREGSKRQTF